MGLLSGVGADVTSLVLETMEGLLAQRALVGPGKVLARLVLGLLGILEEGRHQAHGGRRHGLVLVVLGSGSSGGSSGGRSGGRSGGGRDVVAVAGGLGSGGGLEVVVEDAVQAEGTYRWVGLLHVISTSGVGSEKVGEGGREQDIYSEGKFGVGELAQKLVLLSVQY